MRKQPVSPPQIITPKQFDNVITQTREYQLITPLYGGGVNPNEADPVTVIRATEIRGHLRFWWRACRGGEFNGSSEKMWEKENEIWGKAYKKNEPTAIQTQTIQIIVDINPSKQGKPIKPFIITEKGRPKSTNSIPSYAAFPLQPDQDTRKELNPYIPDVWKDISFTMIISFPEIHRKDVEAALWAWETFGGIGARTRRGFGALQIVKIDGVEYTDIPASNNVEQWISNHLAQFTKSGIFPRDLPYLSTKTQVAVTNPCGDSMNAWRGLIDRLHNFRQARAGRPGRSLWPEAETIREITGRRHWRYKKLGHPQKFPRAAFGLPIPFHFKDEHAGDPKDITLVEIHQKEGQTSKEDYKKQARFASPLILRPFLCSDKRAVGLALLMEGSRVNLANLTLAEKDGSRSYSVQGMLTKSEAQSITVLKGETDVLQAFMKSLKGVRE